MSDYNPENLSNGQLWVLGLSALLSERNGKPLDRLRHHENVDGVRHFVKRDWGIESRDELLDMLQWLKDEGHNQSYLETQAFMSSLSEESMNAYINASPDNNQLAKRKIVKNYRHVLGKGGISAWDYGRYASLCQWGVIVEWLEEDECWEKLFSIARKAQQEYLDWYDYGVSYIAGRLYWRGVATGDNTDAEMEVIRRIIANANSPWNKINWNESLVY